MALTGWEQHLAISVPALAVPADGQPFELFVQVVADANLAGVVQASGGDVRFSLPDGTALPFELVSVDAVVGSLTAYVLLPAFDGVTAPEVHLDVGNPTATSISSPALVFPAHSVMAHCIGDPTGLATVPDSSAVAVAGNIVGAMLPARTLSPMGTGYFDDGGGNEIEFNANSFNPYLHTVSYWSADVDAGASVNMCGVGGGAEDVIRCDEDGTVPEIAGKTDWLNSGGWAVPMVPTGWHRRTITYDDTTATQSVYEDGVLLVADVGGAMPAGLVGTFTHFGARHGNTGAFIRDVAALEVRPTVNSAARELAYYQNQSSAATFYTSLGWAANIITSEFSGGISLGAVVGGGLLTINTYTITQAFNLADGSPMPDGVAVAAYRAASFGAGLELAGAALTLNGVVTMQVTVGSAVILIVDYQNAALLGQVAMTNQLLPVVT